MKAVLFVAVAFLFAQASASLMSTKEVQQSVTVTDAGNGYARAFQANWWPPVNPSIVQIIGVNADENAAKTEGEVDAVEFIMDVLAEAALAFGYFHAQGDLTNVNGSTSASNISGAGFAMAMRIFHVFEFVDNDGNQGFQNGTNDTVTGWYDLSSILVPWNPINITASNVTYNGTDYKLFVCTVSTTDNVFLMRFIAVGLPATVEGIKIDPNSIKVDFEIQWFNNPLFPEGGVYFGYSSGPSNTSNAQVGLSTAFAAAAGEFNQQPNAAGVGPSVNFTSGGIAGYFSWAPNASVTVAGIGAAGAVNADIVTTDTSSVSTSFQAGWVISIIYYSFAAIRPSDVAWDPTFGAALPSTSMQSSMHNAAGFTSPFVALIIGCIALVMFKKH